MLTPGTLSFVWIYLSEPRLYTVYPVCESRLAMSSVRQVKYHQVQSWQAEDTISLLGKVIDQVISRILYTESEVYLYA
jgi:hypothetical protein